MIITLKEGTGIQALEELEQKLMMQGVPLMRCKQGKKTLLNLESKPSTALKEQLEKHPMVESLNDISVPYKLASRANQKEDTVIRLGEVEIGGNALAIIAGPCAIESQDQLVTIANGLKNSGVKILRGSAYKPRTSPYSFQGLGEKGLKMHANAKKHHGLLIETEVMDTRQVELVSEYVDILRVGARNMHNFDLLKALGQCNKPVILKRGLSATIEEWLLSAEYIMAHGNPQVILCERGIRTFETEVRNTLDLSAVALAKQHTHLPVLVDPSHAAGRKDILLPLCKAAIAAGADGLLIEVHHTPEESKCDAKQALSLEEFNQIIKALEKISTACGKELAL